MRPIIFFSTQTITKERIEVSECRCKQTRDLEDFINEKISCNMAVREGGDNKYPVQSDRRRADKEGGGDAGAIQETVDSGKH